MRMRISLTCVPMAISNRRSSKTSCRANTFLSYHDNHHNHHNNWLNHLKYLCHLRDDQLGKIHSRIVTGVDHLEIHRKPFHHDHDNGDDLRVGNSQQRIFMASHYSYICKMWLFCLVPTNKILFSPFQILLSYTSENALSKLSYLV